MRIEAPFSDEQVERLNAWQQRGDVHPFTCPGNNPDCWKGRDLVARPDGWVCPCGAYRQYWAHDFMAGDGR